MKRNLLKNFLRNVTLFYFCATQKLCYQYQERNSDFNYWPHHEGF